MFCKIDHVVRLHLIGLASYNYNSIAAELSKLIAIDLLFFGIVARRSTTPVAHDLKELTVTENSK